MDITTVGLDLAKRVFQGQGMDEAGHVVVKRRLRRAQVITYFPSLRPCLIGMEACATAHFWARELRSLGHEVRPMPPQYVKTYVKRGKNDAADAAAIFEAVTRPSMRFVPVKTEDQQSALLMYRARERRRITAWHKDNPVRRRLATIPGIGPLIATAIVATVPDPKVFRNGREFAAWLGLVPRQKSTGGRPRLGRISRLGDAYIRQLLIVGAQTALLRSKVARSNAWIQGLLARRPRLVVAVALAKKTARIVWATMANEQSYRQAVPA